jgi:hypothetical protein
VPVAIAGDPALAVSVYETVCDAFVRRASTPHGDRVFADRLASSRKQLFPLSWALWLTIGIQPDETWFGIITRQSIRRGTLSTAKPFTWTATADEILAKARTVQTNIKKLVDNNPK